MTITIAFSRCCSIGHLTAIPSTLSESRPLVQNISSGGSLSPNDSSASTQALASRQIQVVKEKEVSKTQNLFYKRHITAAIRAQTRNTKTYVFVHADTVMHTKSCWSEPDARVKVREAKHTYRAKSLHIASIQSI